MSIISCSALTVNGNVRDNNEDNYYVNGKIKESTDILTDRFSEDCERGQYLFGVCDGMGGEELGELASLLAVQTLADYQATDIRQTVADYIEKANRIICDEGSKNKSTGIGTTVVLLYIKDGIATTFNIGDSRAYLFRKNELTQLSEDHTQVQRLVKMGLLEKDAAKGHRDRNVLTQHLGIHPDEMIIEAHVSQKIAIEQNDIFLLCSDGLTDMISDEKISGILAVEEINTTALANELIRSALEGGGRDNATVIVVKVNDYDALEYEVPLHEYRALPRI